MNHHNHTSVVWWMDPDECYVMIPPASVHLTTTASCTLKRPTFLCHSHWKRNPSLHWENGTKIYTHPDWHCALQHTDTQLNNIDNQIRSKLNFDTFAERAFTEFYWYDYHIFTACKQTVYYPFGVLSKYFPHIFCLLALSAIHILSSH